MRSHLQLLIGVLYMQLIVYTAVALFYSLQLYFFFVCLCVHLFIHNKLISSYFSAWPSHSARLDLLFLSGCALLFSQLFTFNVFALLYQENNKDCCYDVVMDLVMRRTVCHGENGFRWKFTSKLDDLEFADDVAL